MKMFSLIGLMGVLLVGAAYGASIDPVCLHARTIESNDHQIYHQCASDLKSYYRQGVADELVPELSRSDLAEEYDERQAPSQDWVKVPGSEMTYRFLINELEFIQAGKCLISDSRTTANAAGPDFAYANAQAVVTIKYRYIEVKKARYSKSWWGSQEFYVPESWKEGEVDLNRTILGQGKTSHSVWDSKEQTKEQLTEAKASAVEACDERVGKIRARPSSLN